MSWRARTSMSAAFLMAPSICAAMPLRRWRSAATSGSSGGSLAAGGAPSLPICERTSSSGRRKVFGRRLGVVLDLLDAGAQRCEIALAAGRLLEVLLGRLDGALQAVYRLDDLLDGGSAGLSGAGAGRAAQRAAPVRGGEGGLSAAWRRSGSSCRRRGIGGRSLGAQVQEPADRAFAPCGADSARQRAADIHAGRTQQCEQSRRQ